MSILEEIRQRVFAKHADINKCIELIQQFDQSFFPCSPDETPETYEEQLNEYVSGRLEYYRRSRSKMKISFLFAWYDLWIGLYYDRKNKWLYILPIPFFGVVIKFKECMHSYATKSVSANRIEKECIYCNDKKVFK